MCQEIANSASHSICHILTNPISLGNKFGFSNLAGHIHFRQLSLDLGQLAA